MLTGDPHRRWSASRLGQHRTPLESIFDDRFGSVNHMPFCVTPDERLAHGPEPALTLVGDVVRVDSADHVDAIGNELAASPIWPTHG